ncbi:hypothetical protein AB870_26335 [Pandoraea faecigallinarum]|nr:hypothetical protein AB870_26335 [Pandoraea faecigallinarum]
MLRRLGDAETQDNAIDEARRGHVHTLRSKVVARVEHKLIFASNEVFAFEQRLVATAVGIGLHVAQRTALAVNAPQLDTDAGAGLAVRCI